jgi:hypothetical protein
MSNVQHNFIRTIDTIQKCDWSLMACHTDEGHFFNCTETLTVLQCLIGVYVTIKRKRELAGSCLSLRAILIIKL